MIIINLAITKKPSEIVKFTKIRQTLRNIYLTGPKRSRIKLVVPPNLLKQENVFLIPRKAEHPSNGHLRSSGDLSYVLFTVHEKKSKNNTDLKFCTHTPLGQIY